jgi:hypothetical protein
MEGTPQAGTRSRPPVGRRLAAGVIVALMFVGAFSLWTVIPFGWIWLGSQLSDTQRPQMGVYALVLVGIICSILLVAKVLSMLNRRLAALSGFDEEEEGSRVPLPWMRSMRDEQRHARTSALDAVLVASACAAGVAMFVWFVLFAGSPLPSQ